jgi:hypothetical protein
MSGRLRRLRVRSPPATQLEVTKSEIWQSLVQGAFACFPKLTRLKFYTYLQFIFVVFSFFDVFGIFVFSIIPQSSLPPSLPPLLLLPTLDHAPWSIFSPMEPETLVAGLNKALNTVHDTWKRPSPHEQEEQAANNRQ